LLAYLSAALGHSGNIAQARFGFDSALAEARRLSDAHTLAHALANAFIAGWNGRSEPTALLQYADEALALSGQREFPHWRDLALVHRGWCLAALGHPVAGIPLLTSGLAGMRTTGSAITMPVTLTMLGDAYRMAGQPQVGLGYIAEAERLAEATQVKSVLAETFRLRGDLQILTGDRAAAEVSFRNAIALSERQGAKLFELRSSTSLARVWRGQGKRADAQALLAPIYAWFTEGFDAPDLIEAKALLHELA
jgi:predicted ATPase